MKKHVLRLAINGKKKKFKAPQFVSAAVLQKTLELENDLKKEIEPIVILKKCYPLLCDIFGNQFTVSELEKGLDIREVLPITEAALDYVISYMELSRGGVMPSQGRKVIPFGPISRK